MDVSTRWNSTHDMVSCYLNQQAAVFAALTSNDVKKNLKDIVTLSGDDIQIAEELVGLLKPFKTVTNVMGDTTIPTVSLIHPLKELMMSSLKIQPSDSGIIKQVKSTMENNLKSRYSEPALLEFLLLSSAIDPRFKSLPYVDDTRREEIYDVLLTKTVFMYDKQVRVKEEKPDSLQTSETTETSSADHSPPHKKQCALDELFGEVFVVKVEAGKNIHESVALEIKNYRSEPLLELKSSPFLWWKINEQKYPLLANFAKYVLAIPATSVASERVFSTAGDIVTAQRATLDSDNVDMLVFLAKNLSQADL